MPHDTNEARACIRRTYGQYFSRSGAIKLLHRMGFDYSRPKLLPAYAPHLNAIERLWGVMHKYVTHNSFYSTYKQFAEAILAFFSRTVPKEWPQFRDTVTDNFRIISFKNFRVLE